MASPANDGTKSLQEALALCDAISDRAPALVRFVITRLHRRLSHRDHVLCAEVDHQQEETRDDERGTEKPAPGRSTR